MQRALLVDLGGTNTRVSTLAADGSISEPVHFASTELPGLSHALASVHRGEKTAVIALAGQVRGPVAKITNLAFSVDAGELARDLGFTRVVLVNDLVAHGVGLLRPDASLATPFGRTRPSVETGPVAIVAPGTGLGEAVFEQGQKGALWVRSTEGGHSAFLAPDETAFRYGRFVAKQPGRVSIPSAEDAIAGHGLGLLYRFFVEEIGLREPKQLCADVATAADPNKLVVTLALAGKGLAAPRAVRTYVQLLALEAQSVALKHLAFGGVILAGGLAASLRTSLLPLGFRDAFVGQGPFAAQLAKVPLAVAKGASSALEGCAALAGAQKTLLEASQFGLFVHRVGR
jgi:glucokinase